MPSLETAARSLKVVPIAALVHGDVEIHEVIPSAASFGVLAEPTLASTPSLIADLQAAAHTLGLQLTVDYARTDSDLETAFETFSQRRVGAVLVSDGTFYTLRTEQLVGLATHTVSTPWPAV